MYCPIRKKKNKKYTSSVSVMLETQDVVFKFELLCAFEFIDIHFTNFDDCQDYLSMATGSEKYVIASIAKTYRTFWKMPLHYQILSFT